MKVELVTNLKRQSTKILAELHDGKEAVLITEHGQPSACLVDVQDYEFMQRRLALLEGLSKGERAIVEGKTTSHTSARGRMQVWLKWSGQIRRWINWTVSYKFHGTSHGDPWINGVVKPELPINSRHPVALKRNSMTDHAGSCLCGTVKFEVAGDFDSFYLCHCKHCQKDTGSAHAANLFSQSAKLHWLAGADAVTHFTLAGTRHSKSFCKLCGSALPNNQAAGLLVVPAGCLDSKISMVPTAHIFTSSKAAWDRALEAVPEFAGLPG